MSLSGSQTNRLHQAILAAYQRDELRRVTLVGMDLRLDDIVADTGFAAQVLGLIEWLDQRGRVAELIISLHSDNPGNSAIQSLFQEAQSWPPFEVTAPTFPRKSWEPETLFLAAGPALLGRAAGPGVPEEDTPAHTVELAAFRVGRTPITNREYAEFVTRVSAQPSPRAWFNRRPPEELQNHPVTNVTWHDAVAYCRWLSEAAGRPYRLLTEAEWERAARGVESRIYPWGNEWCDGRCNIGTDDTTPVDAFGSGASADGCLDMLGNVQEWVSTLWGGNLQRSDFLYPYRPDDGREDLTAALFRDKVFRIHRGGSFRSAAGKIWCGARGRAEAESTSRWRGFRIGMSV